MFDPADGRPVALLDGTHITAARTAAGSRCPFGCWRARTPRRSRCSAPASRLGRTLGRSRGRRDLEEVRLAGRDPERTAGVAAELAELGRPFAASATHAEAIAGAGHRLRLHARRRAGGAPRMASPGAHVTSVGYNPHGRELDDATVADALVRGGVARVGLAPAPAGTPDLTEPIDAVVIGPEHVHAEIGELVAGTRRAGRTPGRSPSTSRWAWRCRTPPPRWCSPRPASVERGAR